MSSSHANRRRSAVALLALALALLVAAVIVSPPARATADDSDGCDPAEAVACLPLPAESDGGAEPARADREAPAAAAPQRPDFCIPVMSGETTIAAPVPSPRPCPDRDVVATINRANGLYARALRTLDPKILQPTWGGEALAQVEQQVMALEFAGRYGTPSLRSIALEELSVNVNSARVRTLEHWTYQERERWSGSLVVNEDQWVTNIYHLARSGGGWQVQRNIVMFAPAPPAPPPAPVVSVRLFSDASGYPRGATVRATVVNEGSVELYSGPGYACSIFEIERQVQGRWVPVPNPPTFAACPEIALVLAPGDSHTAALPTALGAGAYRLLFRYSAASGPSGVAYSSSFSVR